MDDLRLLLRHRAQLDMGDGIGAIRQKNDFIGKNISACIRQTICSAWGHPLHADSCLDPSSVYDMHCHRTYTDLYCTTHKHIWDVSQEAPSSSSTGTSV